VPNRCGNKVQSTFTISDMDAKSSLRRDNRRISSLLEPTNTEGKTAPCRWNSKKAVILAYISHGQGICRTPKQGEDPRTFRARVYETLRRIKPAANPLRNVRIMMYPTTDWERVWANLHATWATDSIKDNWFKDIHDILPTNERLHAIRLAGSPSLLQLWGA
jgi:hypothetical protein